MDAAALREKAANAALDKWKKKKDAKDLELKKGLGTKKLESTPPKSKSSDEDDDDDEDKKKPKLGSGKRFEQLSGKLAKKGVKDPDALAASIGRKKYGNKKMSAMATAGKKRAY